MPDEIRRRGPRPSPEKRNAILAAAASAFATRGVDASTTREIARSADTTERTLFKHFGSKEGLVQAVVEAASIEFIQARAYARAIDPTPFTRAEFTAWHRSFLSDRVEHALYAPDNYLILFRELLRDEAFRQRYGEKWRAQVFQPMAAHLGSMQQRGEIGLAQKPTALAGAFFALNIGYLLTRFALAPGMDWNSEGDVRAIAEMFMASCGEPESATNR